MLDALNPTVSLLEEQQRHGKSLQLIRSHEHDCPSVAPEVPHSYLLLGGPRALARYPGLLRVWFRPGTLGKRLGSVQLGRLPNVTCPGRFNPTLNVCVRIRLAQTTTPKGRSRRFLVHSLINI